MYEVLEGSLWFHGKVYVTDTSKFRMTKYCCTDFSYIL